MTNEQLRLLGEELSREIAAGIMAGAAAGAAEFAAQMDGIKREAEYRRGEQETDVLTELADRLDTRRVELKAELASAKGLRRKAIERRLQQLDQAEQEMVRRLDVGDETPETSALPPANVGEDKVIVREHVRKKASAK